MLNDKKFEITLEDELELLEPEDGVFVSRPPVENELEPQE